MHGKYSLHMHAYSDVQCMQAQRTKTMGHRGSIYRDKMYIQRTNHMGLWAQWMYKRTILRDINMISYIPVCNIWQETCASLGLTLIHRNHSSSCLFFRSISLIVTELRLITTHMIHKSNNPLFSSLVSSDKSIWNSTLGCRVWVFGPEMEIIAAASLLNAPFMYIYILNVVIHTSGYNIQQMKLTVVYT